MGRRRRRRRKTYPWSLMHPLGHRTFKKRMSIASTIFTPALALEAMAASALPWFQQLNWPWVVAKRGESNQSNRGSIPLFWMTPQAPLPSALPRHAPFPDTRSQSWSHPCCFLDLFGVHLPRRLIALAATTTGAAAAIWCHPLQAFWSSLVASPLLILRCIWGSGTFVSSTVFFFAALHWLQNMRSWQRNHAVEKQMGGYLQSSAPVKPTPSIPVKWSPYSSSTYLQRWKKSSVLHSFSLTYSCALCINRYQGKKAGRPSARKKKKQKG